MPENKILNGPILVTGATGTQGCAVLRALARHGHDVAALVRDPDADRARALGVELRQGDMTQPAGLEAAFAGVAAVYAVTTPFADGTDAEERQGRSVIDAAVTASVPWLILASVASAGRAAVPHFARSVWVSFLCRKLRLQAARVNRPCAEAWEPHERMFAY